MAGVTIDLIDWHLLGNLLFNDNESEREQASALLQVEYAAKARKLELKKLYKANPKEWQRVQNMTDAEYADRLHDRFSHCS
mgnify:FL=1